MNLNDSNKADLDKARQAVKTIAEQPENRQNPLTNLIAGKTKLDEISAKLDAARKLVGPLDAGEFNQKISSEVSDAEYQIVKAAQSASGVDTVTGKVDVSKIDRQEAAWVNRQAAFMLEQTGAADVASSREMIGRFFEVDDAERKSHLANGVIDRWQTKSHASMGAVAVTDEQGLSRDLTRENAQRKLQFVLKEDPFKREWKVPSVWGEDKLLRINTETPTAKKTLAPNRSCATTSKAQCDSAGH